MSWQNVADMAEMINQNSRLIAGAPIKKLGEGVQAVGKFVATGGTPSTSDYFANTGDAIISGGKYMEDHPLRSVGIGATSYLANQFLGNPVGGMVDGVTLGATNFRADADEVAPPAMQYSQGAPMQGSGMPPLDAKQMAYEIRRLEKISAVNNLTLGELRRLQAGGGQPQYR